MGGGRERVKHREKRIRSIVIKKILVAYQIMNLTMCGSNIVGFNGVVLSVISDVSVDGEVPVATSSISKIRWFGLRKC